MVHKELVSKSDIVIDGQCLTDMTNEELKTLISQFEEGEKEVEEFSIKGRPLRIMSVEEIMRLNFRGESYPQLMKEAIESGGTPFDLEIDGKKIGKMTGSYSRLQRTRA